MTPDVGNFLIREIELLNQTVARERYEGSITERLDTRLEQAKTIKDSVEKLVERLPNRVKKILEVLNELLSLVGV